MFKRLVVLLAAIGSAVGCAHSSVSGPTLDRIHRPAFVSRIEDDAGPRSMVFRDDSSYGAKLKKLDAKEADRRLVVKLQKGITRFELSESLRAKVVSLLPRVPPWTQTVDPAQVATALESFLVEEVPANAPDYELLRPLGADAVIEFVVERYGMRSSGGKAGTFIEGYGRLFFLSGGGDVWRRSFRADQIESGAPHVDPFKLAKDPVQFRNELGTLIDGVATQFAKDLTPRDRREVAAPPSENRDAPGAAPRPAGPARNDELPDPDPI